MHIIDMCTVAGKRCPRCAKLRVLGALLYALLMWKSFLIRVLFFVHEGHL